jgi:hypothetical protein
MTGNNEPWRTPEWEAEYIAMKDTNPELAQAMLELGLPAGAAGMIVAGAKAYGDTIPWKPEDGVITYCLDGFWVGTILAPLGLNGG